MNVELRWFTPAPTYLYGVNNQPAEVMPGRRVLQFRVFRTYRVEGNHAIGLADWADDYGWSDWQDVPEVAGESLFAAGDDSQEGK